MHFSRWCHSFQKENVTALIDSLSLSVVYVATNELNKFRAGLNTGIFSVKTDLVKMLIDEKMLITDQNLDDQRIVDVRKKLQSNISLEMLYLLVTDGCNLRCRYCFEDSPQRDDKYRSMHMKKETVIKAINLFAEINKKHGNPEKEKVIILYGGEPLTNRHAVFEAILHVNCLKANRVLPDNCKISIVTNGVLLNEDDAKFFSKNNVTVGLSIDGPAKITDYYRIPKRNGIIVSDSVSNAFDLLKRYNVRIGLSVTLTPMAIKYFDDFLDFFLKSKFNTADGMSLSLLHFTPNIKLVENHYAEAVRCQIEAFKRFREINFFEDRVMRKVQAFINQELIYADCGVVGSQLVVAPDGRIGACPDFVKPRTYYPRSVFDNNHDDLINTLFADWRNRSPLCMPQCIDCSALGICGGGCPASAELKTGNRNNLDDRACQHSKQILEWLVWDAYSKIYQ